MRMMSEPNGVVAALHISEHIHIVRDAYGMEMTVDGIPFPFRLANDGIQLNVHPGQMPTVNITMVARHITVDNDVRWRQT